ncbi:hypothetical protein AB205_0179170, partial [Aquarana catesbeiana]
QQEDASRKRERIASEPGAETKKSDKKRLKHVEKTGEEAAVDKVPFIPFDYSKSDFKVFAGSSRVEGRSEFDPNKQAQSGKVRTINDDLKCFLYASIGLCFMFCIHVKVTGPY